MNPAHVAAGKSIKNAVGDNVVIQKNSAGLIPAEFYNDITDSALFFQASRRWILRKTPAR